jgi:S1-C subfamily serine protease
LSQKSEIPFTKTKTTATKSAPKYKVTLGIMPSYADTKDGLHIDGVTDGRPAAVAGIVSGDILIQIGDCKITEVYSYMECLAKLNAGDERDVTVIRNGEKKCLR